MTDSLRRAGAAFAALVAVLLIALALSPAAMAAAPPDANTVISAWKSGNPLYVVSGSSLKSDQQTDINDSLKDASSSIYAVALPDGTFTNSTVGPYIKSLGTGLQAAGRPQATVVVLDGTTLFTASSALKPGVAARLSNLSVNANKGDVVAGMQDFVKRVDLAVDGKRSALES
ncbi:MAG: hypothetical protein HOY71_08170, partial [Nonomuraea sp.]|nr:hypothetical protein [Nonomuraea sp.]